MKRTRLNKFVIYLIISPSGKKYIGQTSRGTRQRWKEHCNMNNKRCPILKKAITKYGADNFVIKQLERTNNKVKANELEEFYIKKLNTLIPNGYNMSEKGNGMPPGFKQTDKTKKAISENKKEYYKISKNREDQSKRMRKFYNTEEGKHLQSERALLQNKPEIKEKIKNILKTIRNTDEYKEAKSLEQKVVWSNPTLLIKHSELIKEQYKNGRIVWNKGKKLKPHSEETKLKISNALKKRNNGHS